MALTPRRQPRRAKAPLVVRPPGRPIILAAGRVVVIVAGRPAGPGTTRAAERAQALGVEGVVVPRKGAAFLPTRRPVSRVRADLIGVVRE